MLLLLSNRFKFLRWRWWLWLWRWVVDVVVMGSFDSLRLYLISNRGLLYKTKIKYKKLIFCWNWIWFFRPDDLTWATSYVHYYSECLRPDRNSMGLLLLLLMNWKLINKKNIWNEAIGVELALHWQNRKQIKQKKIHAIKAKQHNDKFTS